MYRTYSDFLAICFPGKKIQKLTIDAGFTCPNRDGTLGSRGCSFCNPESFTPAYCRRGLSITDQIEAGKRFFAHKHRSEVSYLVYFQSYSCTYASLDVLRQHYLEALSVPDVIGLVIGTRPDCITPAVLDLLKEIKTQMHTFVMLEIGVESCYDRTLQFIGRGHNFDCSRQAIEYIAATDIPVGVHLILGLPGETSEAILHEADILSTLPISVLKLHQLQILRHTPMGEEWLLSHQSSQTAQPLSLNSYISLVSRFVLRLRNDIALDRFVAESPRSLLLAPCWGIKPQEVQRMIDEEIIRLNRDN